MTDAAEGSSLTALSLEDLEAHQAEVAKALAAKRAERPLLTVEQAEANLEAAEAALVKAEGPGQDVEHARFNLATAVNFAATAPSHVKEQALAPIPELEAAHAKALARHADEGSSREEIDLAAQAVLDARADLRRAKGEPEPE